MLAVVLGITYGALIGLFGNWLLFNRLDQNKQQGVERLKGIGRIFFFRYLVDAIALFAFALAVRHTWAIISSALSLTLAVKISILIVYARKGGKID